MENTKIVDCTGTRTLADGTVKKYQYKKVVKVKGFVNADGSVSKFSDEQKAEIKRLRGTGVTITRLAKDYEVSAPTIKKIVGE